jgi:hypothetical protein
MALNGAANCIRSAVGGICVCTPPAGQAFYSNAMMVTVSENYGQLRVASSTTGLPLPKVYVKVRTEWRPAVDWVPGVFAVGPRGGALCRCTLPLRGAAGVLAPVALRRRPVLQGRLHGHPRRVRLHVPQHQVRAPPPHLASSWASPAQTLCPSARPHCHAFFTLGALAVLAVLAVLWPGSELANVERFSILVVSPTAGSIVRDAKPPKQ